MDAQKPCFYITTAISYPNGLPHIGHAYEAIATDVIARFKRLDGWAVKFVTGTDDHGQKMFRTAREQGMTAQALADELTPRFRNMVAALNCANDDFIRTSQARHHRAVAAIWEKMQARGDIFKNVYAGWYSVRDEAFYGDGEVTENEQGEKIAPSGAQVEWVEEDSYFFRLSAYEDKLLAFYEAHPDFIQPATRRNEVMSFVKMGLKDLSISRTSFKWGVSVPDDPTHIVYVWVDALTNYLTALGYPDDMGAWWPASLHVIGKDIIRFHAVYWPAFLMSAGLDIPKRIFAHGFLTLRGEKMSKSRGNVMDPQALIELYGVDAVRYYFMSEVCFGSDGSFSDEAIVARVNADLANDLGNLAQRSLSMLHKNCDGVLPAQIALTKDDEALLAQTDALYERCEMAMRDYAIDEYIGAIMELVAAANRYFDQQKPWALKNTDPSRQANVLYVTAETLRQIGILIQPVIPEGAATLLDYLAVAKSQRDFVHLGARNRLACGISLPPPAPIFPRLQLSEPDSEPDLKSDSAKPKSK